MRAGGFMVSLALGWGSLHANHGPWQEMQYRGRTEYQVMSAGEAVVLHAEARHSNSALFHAWPRGAPIERIRWRWRVLRHPNGADPSRRAADDRAAAVFVMVRRSILPWRTRGLLYQWAPAATRAGWTSSPYASGIRVLTLSTLPSGPDWIEEQRDLRADLLAAFGEVPDRIEAIGVLCDSDNTGDEAIAEFGEIVLEPSTPTSPR